MYLYRLPTRRALVFAAVAAAGLFLAGVGCGYETPCFDIGLGREPSNS
jgi:hypothetical protein